jgi:predicted molibdopterin-dependent oxidoreductase YjgC
MSAHGGRISGGRIPGLGERAAVSFVFEGQPVHAFVGDTVAMALWAAEQTTLRNSSRDGKPRGVLCNMGICYDCLVVIDGVTVRSCTTVVREGMQVQRGGKP